MFMLGGGLGLQLLGGIGGMGAAESYNNAKLDEVQQEQQVDNQRRQAMELDANRKLVENVRNVQRAQALGLVNANAQGAQYSSGFQSGQQQATNQGNWNQEGVLQNLYIGRNIFDLNQKISSDKMLEASAQQSSSFWGGIGQMGGSLVQGASAFGKLASGWAPTNSFGPQQNMYQGTGEYWNR